MIRVRDLAAELGITTEAVLRRLHHLGLPGYGPDTRVPPVAAERVRAALRTVGEDPIPADAGRESPTGTLRRIIRTVRPSWAGIAAVILIDLLATPLVLLLPIPLKVVVDSVIGNKPVPGYVRAIIPHSLLGHGRLLWVAAALQVLIVVLNQFQAMVSYILHTKVGEGITLHFRSLLFRHGQRLSILYHDAKGTNDSLYRVQYDAPALQWVTVDGISPFISAVVTLVTILYVMGAISLELCLISLAVCPVLVILARSYRSRIRPRYRSMKGIESDAMQVVQETLSALRVVKAFGSEDREERRFVNRSTETVRSKVSLAVSEGWFGILVNATTALGTALVLVVGVHEVQAHTITLGQLLMVTTYLTQLYGPLKTVSTQYGAIQASMASAERAFELLDEAPEVPERPNPTAISRARGDLELQDVSFAYAPGQPVLEHVSLVVPAGARVGITGRTGTGKTTLVSLFLRFFDPSAGRIALDGTDLRDYRLADLREQFSIVPQDTILLSTTIGENIAYARPGATQAEIVEAAKAAGAHDFIAATPQAYNTVVGERGMRLSGGERQRVAIARAFLKDAPILILDEPTSSIDVATEGVIMNALERLMVGRTTFMIAHRLSTLERCDVRLEVSSGNAVVDVSHRHARSPGAAHRSANRV